MEVLTVAVKGLAQGRRQNDTKGVDREASHDASPSSTSPPHLKLPVVCLVSACISAVTAPASSCHPIHPCRSLQSDKESIIELAHAHEHCSRDCVAPGCETRPLASAAAPVEP